MVGDRMAIVRENNPSEDSGKNTSNINKQELEQNMDDFVWSSLPEDLQLRILAHLPLDSLARLERVCRDWKSLWQNRGFLNLRSQVETEAASSNCWFIFQRPLKFRSNVIVDCYNTHSNKWHKLRFDDLPPIEEVCVASGSLLLCAGGILAVDAYYSDDNYYKFFDLIVCNPLKLNSWERIPKQQGSFIRHIGMVADERTGNYKVVLASFQKTEIYDSRQKNWKSFDSIFSSYVNVLSSPVEYRGRLLYLGIAPNPHGKVFAYNLEDNTCSTFDSDFNESSLHNLGYLESCAGRLLMISLCEVSPARNFQSYFDPNFELRMDLRVVEYVHTADDLSDGMWRELTSIPTFELEKSMSVNSNEGGNFLAGVVASSSSRNDLLCFTTGIKDGKFTYFDDANEKAVFLYSLSQNLWRFVGKQPEWDRDDGICARSFQFKPSLYVPLVRK